MKIGKKAANILGIALVYTITSSFVALMPHDLIATKSYFSAKGEVSAAISTLNSEEIIYIDAENFDVNEWIQNGETNIYIINLRDDKKPIVVYFEVVGSIRKLIGGINPLKIYPGENGEKLKMPIRDISLFGIRDESFSGTIKIRAFNDYINDLEIEIPEIKGNHILSLKEKQWPYGSAGASIMSVHKNNATVIDLLSKYDINTYEDMVGLINDFEILEEKVEELQAAYGVLLAEKDTLLKEKEQLVMNNEILSNEKEEFIGEINKIKSVKDSLNQAYNSLKNEVEKLRNRTNSSPSTGGSTIPAQPPIPVVPDPADPVPTDPTPDEPVIDDPIAEDPNGDEQQGSESDDQKDDDRDETEDGNPSSGDSGSGNRDIIDDRGKDDDDSDNDFADDGEDDIPSRDNEPQENGDQVSVAIKEMADVLKNYI